MKKKKRSKGEWGIVLRPVKAPKKSKVVASDDKNPGPVSEPTSSVGWAILPSTPFKAPSRPIRRVPGPSVTTPTTSSVAPRQDVLQCVTRDLSTTRLHPLDCPYNCEPVYVDDQPQHFFGMECGEYRMCPWWSREGRNDAPF